MRDVVYEHEFDEQFAAIEPEFERADAFVKGVEWVLARDPTRGNCVDRQHNIWHMPLIDIFETALAVYYTFDDRTVYMLSIRVADDYLENGS
jgi:hypothetical protein